MNAFLRIRRIAGVLLVLCVSTVCAQSFRQVYPATPITDYASLIRWNGDTLFAGGTNGVIIRSTDAGATWTRILPALGEFDFISLGANRTGVYILQEATYRTASMFEDPDSSWIFHYSPFTGETRRIAFPLDAMCQETHAYGSRKMQVTSDGVFLLTGATFQVKHPCTRLLFHPNEGSEWIEVTVPDSLQNDRATIADFSSRNVGFILGYHGGKRTLFHTRDGGLSWKECALGSAARFSGPSQWIDANTFAIMADDHALYVSTDFGDTWNPYPYPPCLIGSFYFSDTRTAIVRASENSDNVLGIFGTVDGGATWETLHESEELHASILPKMLALGRDTLVVAGKYGFLLRTVDRGLTWDHICHETRNGYRSFSFSSNADGIAQAYDPADRRYSWIGTEDGCTSWRPLGDDALIRNMVLYRVDRSNIWSVDAQHLHKDSLIFLSDDGGEHWTPKCFGAAYDSVAIITMEGGKPDCGRDSLIVLTNKGILRTVDRGASWRLYPQVLDLLTTGGTKVGYAGLFAHSGRTQWLHRSDKILKSRDFGMTWATAMQLPDSAIAGGSNYNSMSVDGDVVHVSLDMRQTVFPIDRIILFHSTDAGTTWVSYIVDSTNTSLFLGVPFLHNTFANGTGFALQADASNYFSREDAVYKTTDSWRTYSVAFAVSIIAENIGSGRTLKFFDENHGWLAIGNTIWSTSNGGVDWVERPTSIPGAVTLNGVYPNPASTGSGIAIAFTITGDRPAPVTIDVFDVMGRRVRDRYAGTAFPGHHELHWSTRGASPGVYIVRVESGGRAEVRRMIVAR